jgi:chromosome segregation ATPase
LEQSLATATRTAATTQQQLTAALQQQHQQTAAANGGKSAAAASSSSSSAAELKALDAKVKELAEEGMEQRLANAQLKCEADELRYREQTLTRANATAQLELEHRTRHAEALRLERDAAVAQRDEVLLNLDKLLKEYERIEHAAGEWKRERSVAPETAIAKLTAQNAALAERLKLSDSEYRGQLKGADSVHRAQNERQEKQIAALQETVARLEAQIKAAAASSPDTQMHVRTATAYIPLQCSMNLILLSCVAACSWKRH